jgi:tRNA 2-selenouridine synthase
MVLGPRDVFPRGAGRSPFALIDVRSPVETSRGALPHAEALPLMTDLERHLVGIRYKEAGQAAAIALGFELAGPHLADRAEAWRVVCDRGPTAVTCWRGGLRSRLAIELIDRPGVHQVDGGYKALRAHLVASIEGSLDQKRLVVLTGLTGSGKTAFLRELASERPPVQVLDLEGLAHHRGSAFGAWEEPQPSQASFENSLAAELLLDPAGTLVVEDESRFVGARTLPPLLDHAMRVAPVVVLEVPLEQRVERVFEEYVRTPARCHGVAATRARLEDALLRLRSRLGGARADAIVTDLRAAEVAWDDPDTHRRWITTLLQEHYDRLYLRAAARHDRPVLARGDAELVRQALLAQAVTAVGSRARASVG